jgi:ecdysteroid-regulated protein
LFCCFLFCLLKGPNIRGPFAVRLESCNTEPCAITRGVQDNLEVDFAAPFSSDKITLDVRGKVLGVWLPWAGIDKDACKDKNIKCPLVTGYNYTLKSPIQTLTQYPKLTTLVRYRVLSSNGKNIFCFRMPLDLI